MSSRLTSLVRCELRAVSSHICVDLTQESSFSWVAYQDGMRLGLADLTVHRSSLSKVRSATKDRLYLSDGLLEKVLQRAWRKKRVEWELEFTSWCSGSSEQAS